MDHKVIIILISREERKETNDRKEQPEEHGSLTKETDRDVSLSIGEQLSDRVFLRADSNVDTYLIVEILFINSVVGFYITKNLKRNCELTDETVFYPSSNLYPGEQQI